MTYSFVSVAELAATVHYDGYCRPPVSVTLSADEPTGLVTGVCDFSLKRSCGAEVSLAKNLYSQSRRDRALLLSANGRSVYRRTFEI